MIQLEQIKNYYPPLIRDNADFKKHILKEYIELAVLDYLSATPYTHKITFIGGTNLRLVKGIDRFSEDLDFDCKNFSQEEFMRMTDEIISFLKSFGLRVEVRDKYNPRLTAFRRSIYFPELLFDLGLTGHKEERFLIKIETQNQEIFYDTVMTNIKGCGFFFSFPMPSDAVLCAMKISAMLSRAKGRDFYDAMFLLPQTQPDYDFLAKRSNIHSLEELKQAVAKLLQSVDLNQKKRDFEHLLFNRANSEKILRFGSFVEGIR
ncbi:MAG: nucleotidyl transferase AbiEii/AbiGii toxin family protein [Bacteroidales bacterium]|jgi:predicted nucleotidyltransferase component of viral defense system|nr:nucleotidyl transferase AbiEii/AbiGii toxin family protein [Bacteroidales bacterium]